MKARANTHREVSFVFGGWGWLRMQHCFQIFLRSRSDSKLRQGSSGHYQIRHCIGTVAYELALLETTRIHLVSHVSFLGCFIGPIHTTIPSLPLIPNVGEVTESTLLASTHNISSDSTTFVAKGLSDLTTTPNPQVVLGPMQSPSESSAESMIRVIPSSSSFIRNTPPMGQGQNWMPLALLLLSLRTKTNLNRDVSQFIRPTINARPKHDTRILGWLKDFKY